MGKVMTRVPPDAPPASRAEDRILGLDVLRGLALLGILLVNMRHFASPAMYLPGAELTAVHTPVDQVVNALIASFALGKFFPLFSFLFGVGLAIQLMSWQRKGLSATPMFLRRLSFLLAIGLTHATFIWAGDILAKYAMVGLLFLWFLTLPPRYLLVAAGVFLMVPIGLAWLDFDVRLAMLAGLPATPAEFQVLVQQSVAAYGDGTFMEMTRQRLADYAYRLTAWSYFSGLFTIMAMFCLGAYAGRTGLFRPPLAGRFRRIGLAALAVWGVCLVAFAAGLVPGQLHKVHQMAWNLSTTALYVTAVVLMLERLKGGACLAPLAATGRMGLTNYLLQSVIATFIFYGLGLYGRLGAAECLALTVAIFALQVAASTWWMARYRFGPMEWVWRWGTYGQRPPMRKAPVNPPEEGRSAA